MATSRTGTAVWKQVRAQAIRQARREGIDHCPECGILLDYDVGLQRNSAEVDHIIPHSQGGKDHISNARVCCRRCNQSLGGKAGNSNKAARKAHAAPNVKPITARKW